MFTLDDEIAILMNGVITIYATNKDTAATFFDFDRGADVPPGTFALGIPKKKRKSRLSKAAVEF